VIIPRIISYDEVNGTTEPYRGKARVYFNLGKKVLTSSSWDLVNSNTGVAQTKTQYGLAHHLDDLTSPTFDFNFAPPEVVFYNLTAYTTNGLFTEYHDRFVRELTGRDSKFLKVYMKLNDGDVQGEFLRNLWNIDGIIYRINEVKEYNGNGESPVTTLCELIRIPEGDAPATFTLGTLTKMKQSDIVTNQYPDTIKTSGTGNSVGGQTKNILINGDNNTVPDPYKNVVIFGDNTTATESDVIYINGVPFAGGTDHQSGYYFIPFAETVVIQTNKQMTNWDGLQIEGDLQINGELILR
jgi:hypothetical protein